MLPIRHRPVEHGPGFCGGERIGNATETRMDNRMRLNTAMQAVDVFLEIDGQPVRAVIPREVFEEHLNTPPTPDAWLKACEDHASALDDVIRRRFAAKPQDLVVVRSSDFGVLNE
jgi:hypothetical protein